MSAYLRSTLKLKGPKKHSSPFFKISNCTTAVCQSLSTLTLLAGATIFSVEVLTPILQLIPRQSPVHQEEPSPKWKTLGSRNDSPTIEKLDVDELNPKWERLATDKRSPKWKRLGSRSTYLKMERLAAEEPSPK
ncbi:Uncharacterized protein Fot_34341 [Forsythia ovata]|uniref:Uncharacterized protein n=1 Tax=Forsythia ovata TaxID=205694 RepID=A0ABD1SIC9_9LAMI